MDCIGRDEWKNLPGTSHLNRVFSKWVAFQVVLCLYKLGKELLSELNSLGPPGFSELTLKANSNNARTSLVNDNSE